MNDKEKQILQIRFPLFDAVQLFELARDAALDLAPDADYSESMKLAQSIMLTTAVLKLSDTLEEISDS